MASSDATHMYTQLVTEHDGAANDFIESERFGVGLNAKCIVFHILTYLWVGWDNYFILWNEARAQYMISVIDLLDFRDFINTVL